MMCDRILYSSVIVHSCLGLVEYVRGALRNGHRAPVIIWRVELGPSEKPDCHSQTAGHSKVCALRTIENCQGFFFSDLKIVFGALFKRLQLPQSKNDLSGISDGKSVVNQSFFKAETSSR